MLSQHHLLSSWLPITNQIFEMLTFDDQPCFLQYMQWCQTFKKMSHLIFLVCFFKIYWKYLTKLFNGSSAANSIPLASPISQLFFQLSKSASFWLGLPFPGNTWWVVSGLTSFAPLLSGIPLLTAFVQCLESLAPYILSIFKLLKIEDKSSHY